MARITLTPPDMNPEGIGPTDWVRKIKGRKIGQVERLTGDVALVDWLDGTKQIIGCIHLRRIDQDQRPDLDRRRSDG